MRKGQSGQAFILVLILLTVGSLLIVPSLSLSSSALSNSRIVTREVEGMYAADAAQEWVMWKLTHDNLGALFTYHGQEENYQCDVCGTPVAVTIIMRALEGEGGIVLATDDAIRPTKTVSPDPIDNDALETVTYTIRLEQLSEDNSQGLDAVYDILPVVFADSDYEEGRSYLRVDGGSWESIPNPAIEVSGVQVRLKWPADYDPDTGTGAFSSDSGSPNYFYGIRDFEVRQVKELRFEMTHEFKGEDKNRVFCNWVVLKMEGGTDTLSGPQAPLTVGSPAAPGVCDDDGLLAVSKTSEPEIIQSGVETDIEYTITITNQDGFTHQIQEITDYLPEGFIYIGPTNGGDITTLDPQQSLENINGVDRWVLRWADAEIEDKSILAGVTKTLTFWARVTKDASGSYYNELIVIPADSAPPIFSEIGVSSEEYYTCYSWNTGATLVPYFDARADSGDVAIDSNIAVILGINAFKSWQVK